MSIKIRKGDKYYSISVMKDPRYADRTLWLSTQGGEGMQLGELTEEKLYDAIDKFFQENM